MNIISHQNLSNLFHVVRDFLETPFYSVTIDVQKIVYADVDGHLMPTAELLRTIYRKLKFPAEKHDFDLELQASSMKSLIEAITHFSAHRGDRLNPYVEENYESEWAQDNYTQILSILSKEIETGSPRIFQIIADRRSYFASSGWGGAFVIINDKNNILITVLLECYF